MKDSDQLGPTFSMLGQLAPPNMSLSWWLAAFCVTSGTNLADFFAAAGAAP